MATDPYKYLDQMRARSAQPAVSTADPFEADLVRQRDDETAYRIKVAKPDEDSRVRSIAEARGLPPSVVAGQLPAFEAEARVARAKSAMQEYPAIGRWSAKPGNAAIAADDYDNLGLLGKAFYGLKNLGATLEAGSYSALGGIYGAIGGLAENMDALSPASDAERRAGVRTLPRIIADYTLGVQKADQTAADKARPQVDNWLARNLLQGVESLPTTAASVGVGIVAGPTAGAAVMGSSVAGNEYARAREKGLSPQRSALYGASQGAVEFVTEKMPVSRLVGDLAAKSPLGKTLMRQLAAEIPGEQAATFLQDLNEWATLNPDKTLRQFVAERPAAAAETLVATIGGVGAAVGLTTAAERTARVTAKVLERRQDADRAQANGAFLDQVAEAAAKSKLAGRSPDALADLAQQLGEDTGNDRVFIPAEAVMTYLQSDGYSGEFDSFRDAVDEAYATGGDVVLPMGEVTARIANTPAWAALREDMRLSAGGMSLRESQTFDDAMADVMDDLSEQAAQEAEAARAEMQPRETLRQSIANKLMNAGFTPSTAQQQAELLTQREATRAARMGRDLTGQEFDPVEVRQILPPALAQIQAADNTDILIETMKGGKDAKTAAGPSLVEFIAKGGGIVDTGGDLKAMGADAWHKGKPGKRKLVRDNSGAGQSSLLADGGLGANEYSADQWAMRAWEAGYFPEFEDRPSANDLLDAIAEGVAGRDRFLTAKEKTLRDASQELRGMLDGRGIDPDTATRKEIKDAIAAYQAEVEGVGFDQADTGSAAFKAWFGDSKVVDAKGKPLVVYHGSPDARELNAKGVFQTKDEQSVEAGFLAGEWVERARKQAAYFFTPDKRAAKTYTDSFRAYDRENAVPGLIPTYISLQNPMEVDFAGERWTGTDAAIKAAKEGGYDGVIIRNTRDHYNSKREAKGDKPHLVVVAFDPTQIKSVDNVGTFDATDPRILYQSGDQPRGRIVFPSAGFGTGSSIIELFQRRDQSTFLHETGHLWLEQLRADATDPAAPDALKADWQAVQDWFAGQGHTVTDGIIPVDAHEMWARGVERYLMEGKSPTPVLRKAFEAFKSWLVAIYRSVDRLKSPVTPEIRAVMDRLIATDEEIASANEGQNIAALFTDKPATMTDDEFAAYQDSAIGARDAAHDALLAKAMNAIKRRATKEYQDRRAAIAADVAVEIDARPEFRALADARKTPLDAAWIRETLGEDAPAMLPPYIPKIAKDGGVNPDEAAEMSGFTSGEEMVRALMGVETARRQLREGGDQRSVRKALIDQQADALMMERYGDPFTDGSIEEEALATIHNDQQGEVIAAEMRVLARSTGQRITPYRIAKDWAARTVRSGRVADVASRSAIQRYQRAASKAGKAAMDAVIAGDNVEAFRQKQAQMLNNALISEARRAADEIEAAVARLGKVASKRTMASVDQDYLERAQGLLEQVDLKQRSQRFIDRQDSFEAWAKEQEAGGKDMIVPPSFAATLGATNWTRLTVDQMLGLDAAVKQIMHLGRLKQKLMDAKEERDYEAVVGEAVAQIDGLVESGQLKARAEDRTFLQPGYFASIKAKILSVDASLLKMETVFDWLDGGKFGLFKRVVFQRIADAQERRRKMTLEIVDAIAKAQEAVPKEIRKRWSQKVTLSFIDPRNGRPAVMTRDQLISMALNLGNEGNAKKLAGGYGWSEQSMLDMLNRELTAEEWGYVQKVWDAIDVLWPEIAGLERRLNGVAPEKVEAREVQTNAGILRGGYYPVVYDTSRDLRVEKLTAISADQLFSSAYKRSNTRAGSTNERTEVRNMPILLSPAVLSRHVNEVVHDITHREALIDAHRFLNDARVVEAVRGVLGEDIQKQFNPWLQHIANEFAHDAQGMSALESGLKTIRTNATFVGLAYRVSTILLQVTGFIQTAEVIGAHWMAQGVYSCARHPIGSYQFVMENSQEVAARMNTMDRDMQDMLSSQSRLGKGVSAIKANGFVLIGVVDRFVSVVSWIGAYNKAQARGDGEAQAIAYADEVVRKSQGSGAAKDVAAMVRGKGVGGEAMKMITPFYSFMSAYYQRQRTLARDYGAAFRTGSVSDFPNLMARTIMLYVLPVLATAMLKGDGPDEDDEESYTAWLLGAIGTNALGPIPIARDIANVAIKGFGSDVSSVDRLVGTTSRVIKDMKRLAEGEETNRATRNAMETAGYLGAPTSGQMAATTQFIVDVFGGDQHPEGFGGWYEGLTTGKIKDE